MESGFLVTRRPNFRYDPKNTELPVMASLPSRSAVSIVRLKPPWAERYEKETPRHSNPWVVRCAKQTPLGAQISDGRSSRGIMGGISDWGLIPSSRKNDQPVEYFYANQKSWGDAQCKNPNSDPLNSAYTSSIPRTPAGYL